MKPNTPTKMTMISHITYWCRWSISCAIDDAAGLRHLDGEPPAVELDALIVGGVARLQQERRGEQQHLEARERQDQPRAGECEAGADRQRRDAERGENASQARRRDRAIALEDHAEAARALMERQLAPRIFPRRLEGGHAH